MKVAPAIRYLQLSVTRENGFTPIFINALDEIIAQAERVQELENLIKSHAPEGRNYTNEQYVGLIRDFTRLQEALEFYAVEVNHAYPIYDEYGQFNGSLVSKDAGEKARIALEESQ